jgi:hypothetical protein
VRREIARLLDGRKAVFPLLVEGAALPHEKELPPELRPLLRFQAMSLDNVMWETTMRRLTSEIQALIERDN